MVVGSGERLIPPSCLCYGWLAPCLCDFWSFVVSFAGTSVPRGSSGKVCVCVCVYVCVSVGLLFVFCVVWTLITPCFSSS
jgi:hypothetical protein